MKKLILALALLAGCVDYPCGAYMPVSGSPILGRCPGRWEAVPTGMWYRCECGEVQP